MSEDLQLFSSTTTPQVEEETGEDVLTTEPAKVILFNDQVHTFDEVIDQLIKATRCDLARAEALTWEVHTKGKAAVYEGTMPECIRVSGILEEIALHTQIEV
jgi:ATP-dependent Clp protease adapter protein ClpS